MDTNYKHFLIIELIRVLQGTHATYWELYKLEDKKLLELYDMLVNQKK